MAQEAAFSWKVSFFTLSRWSPKPLIHLFNSPETYLGQWVQLLSCSEPQHIQKALAYNQYLYENYVAFALKQQLSWSVPKSWMQSMNHKITQNVWSSMLSLRFRSKHTSFSLWKWKNHGIINKSSFNNKQHTNHWVNQRWSLTCWSTQTRQNSVVLLHSYSVPKIQTNQHVLKTYKRFKNKSILRQC